MKKARRNVDNPIRVSHPGVRHVAYTAAVAAALAALFQPIPAMAAPVAPVPAPAVPDSGARPIQLGSLVLPGATPAGTPTATPTTTPGVALSPILQLIEKGRAEIATLGDELIRIGQDRDIAQQQVTLAQQRLTEAQTALQQAQTEATAAAKEAMEQAAARPPGVPGSGLLGLDSLARMQRGDGTSSEAAAHRLEAAQISAQVTLDEYAIAADRHADLVAQWTRLNADIGRKQVAQQQLEAANSGELSAAETASNAADQQLGQEYLAGSQSGRGADPRAVQALQFALAQRGDPYVWSEEGPNQYDCSGLMYAAYHSVGYPLVRVSRDQYWQTRNKVVDRYSLLPGDLLFFSYSNSWTGIHHVAMYAGDGLMVEAPRTGLNVRLVPVRWSRLFQATRVFGAVEGGETNPVLGAPDPEEPDIDNGTGGTTDPTNPNSPSNPGTSKPPTNPTSPSKPPAVSPSAKPPTSPSGKPPTSPSGKPPTSPSGKPPTSPSDKPPTSPSDKPPTSSSPKPPTTPAPPPSDEPEPAPSSPASGGGSSSGGGESSGGSASEPVKESSSAPNPTSESESAAAVTSGSASASAAGE